MKYPRYTKDSPWAPSAEKENTVSGLLESLNIVQLPSLGKHNRIFLSNITVPLVLNDDTESYPFGKVVNLIGFSIEVTSDTEDGKVPLSFSAANEFSEHTAILMEAMDADNPRADALLCGVMFTNKISISDTDHLYAKPDANGNLVSAASGPVSILARAASGWCLIGIGMAAGASGSDRYDGPFAVTFEETETLSVSQGFLNRNGDFVTVPKTEGITPKTGYMCVCSEIDDTTGIWSKPEVKFAKPGANSPPIAYIECVTTAEKITSVTITPYYVAVAQITDGRPCKVAIAAESGS